jgi:hypothetical protein
MNDIPTEFPDPSDIDGEDLWRRGIVYFTHQHALTGAEMEVQRLEYSLVHMQYEYEIIQRVRDKTTDAKARQVWQDLADAKHDLITMTEQEIADAIESVAYHRTMVAEIEADLGENAQTYAAILAELEWDGEDTDEIICPFVDECPIVCEDFELFDDDVDGYGIYEPPKDPNDIIH